MAIRAQVIGFEDDGLKVQTEGAEGCNGCTQCSKGKGSMELVAKSDVKYPLGSWVEIDIGAGELNLVSILVYGIPLIIMIVGILVGTYVLNNEILGFGLGFGLSALYFFVIYLKQNLINKNNRFGAKVIGLAPDNLVSLECKKTNPQ